MQRITVTLFLILSLGYAALSQREERPVRTVYVTVESSKIDFVTGLKAENFIVSENKREMPIEHFASGEPASIGFLFDVSDSMLTRNKLDLEDAAAGIYDAIRTQPAGNDYFLIGFNKRVSPLADWTTDAETIGGGLKNLRSIQGKGEGATTVLFDAAFQAIEKLSSARHKKKVLIILSDGGDGVSKHSRAEVVDLTRDRNILVYTLTVREAITVNINSIAAQTPARGPIDPPVRKDGPISQFLRDITDFTGGAAHMVVSRAPGNLDRDFENDSRTPFQRKIEKIFGALRSQYSIGYSPDKQKPGSKTLNLNVKLQLTPDIRKGKGVISLRFREKFNSGD